MLSDSRFRRRRIRLRTAVDAVGVDDSRDQLPRLQPVAVEHGLARVGRAHDDIRSFDHRFRTAHRLNFDIHQLGHFLGKSITVLFRAAINPNLLDGTHTAVLRPTYLAPVLG